MKMVLLPKASYDKIEDIVNPYDEPEDEKELRPSYWILKREQLNILAASDRKLRGFQPTEPLFAVARLYLKYKNIVEHLDKIWAETYQYQKNTVIFYYKIISLILVTLNGFSIEQRTFGGFCVNKKNIFCLNQAFNSLKHTIV